jgi:tRNA dimethylallyltransferase
MHPVIFVVGPTATGKSRVGLELAQHFSGAILNCDSLQVYQRLDIGTAKPSREEQKLVPHYLFDVLQAGDVLTAGDFRKLALAEMTRAKENMIFAVGGSGFYIQALEKGMFEVEKADPEVDRRVRERLAQEGLEVLYEELKTVDPETAEELSPNDAYRIVRALVVYQGSGRKMSHLRASFKPQPFPYPYLKIGLNFEREELLPRVRGRVQDMLKAGFLEEVRALLKDGLGLWPALHSVGYKECVDVLEGRLAEASLEHQIVEKTMQLAKKQRTWFKRDPNIHWLSGQNPSQEAIQCVTQFVAGLDRKA